ncbi:MAG TPA: hypothetical protein VF715_09460 [Thermoleophilaceae bacterium]
MVEGTRHPELEHRLPGFGAFKRDDVEDARRREPASDLRAYAQARGLEFLDRLNPVGYWGVVPDDSRMQFNVMRGVWAGDRQGTLFHKLLCVPLDWDTGAARWRPHVGSDVHEVHYEELPPKYRARGLLELVSPLIGMFTSGTERTDPREKAIGIPTTVAATQVPEAATVPDFRCGGRFYGGNFLPGRGPMQLEHLGVPEMELEATGGAEPDPGFLQRAMEGPFGQVLRHYSARPYARVKVAHGRVSICVDGYTGDPAELDALGAAAVAAADGIAAAVGPGPALPFAEPLGGIDWGSLDTNPLKRPPHTPPPAWVPPLRDLARAYGATPEDAVAYHVAFPRLPAPGTAFAVLRFTPPGGSGVARMAWNNEQTIQRYNTGRNVVSLAAAPGAAPTPPGGVGRNDLGLRYAISDGILCAWARRDSKARGGLGEMDDLVTRVLGLARTEGLGQL